MRPEVRKSAGISLYAMSLGMLSMQVFLYFNNKEYSVVASIVALIIIGIGRYLRR